MNIEFQWVEWAGNRRLMLCRLRGVEFGRVHELDGGGFSPEFGPQGDVIALPLRDSLSKAQQVVEEQARAWLDALTKEGSATAINRTMRKYDLALHKLAKSSEVTKAQPDPRTVIALADAMGVAVRELIGLYEYYESDEGEARQVYEERMERFEEASREFWAALSADGTGESPVLSTHLDVMGEGK